MPIDLLFPSVLAPTPQSAQRLSFAMRTASESIWGYQGWFTAD